MKKIVLHSLALMSFVAVLAEGCKSSGNKTTANVEKNSLALKSLFIEVAAKDVSPETYYLPIENSTADTLSCGYEKDLIERIDTCSFFRMGWRTPCEHPRKDTLTDVSFVRKEPSKPTLLNGDVCHSIQKIDLDLVSGAIKYFFFEEIQDGDIIETSNGAVSHDTWITVKIYRTGPGFGNYTKDNSLTDIDTTKEYVGIIESSTLQGHIVLDQKTVLTYVSKSKSMKDNALAVLSQKYKLL